MSVVFAIRTHLRELNRYSHLQFSELTDYDVSGDREPLKQAAMRLDEAERSLSLAFRLMGTEDDPRHISYIITEQLSRYEFTGFPKCGKDPQVDMLLAWAESALARALSAIREAISIED